MSQVLIRGLDRQVVKALKKRAAGNRRSLQGELKTIIERAVGKRDPEWIGRVRSLRRKTRPTVAVDSVTLLRALRDGR